MRSLVNLRGREVFQHFRDAIGAHTLMDRLQHPNGTHQPVDHRRNNIAFLDGSRRLHRISLNTNPSVGARSDRQGTGLEKTNRPEPLVQSNWLTEASVPHAIQSLPSDHPVTMRLSRNRSGRRHPPRYDETGQGGTVTGIVERNASPAGRTAAANGTAVGQAALQ